MTGKPNEVKQKEIPAITRRPKGRRPKIVINNDLIAKVLELTKQGFLQKDLAAYFGTTPGYWSRLCSQNETLWVATEQGKQFGHEIASSRLMGLIHDGNLQAIIFYLKTRHRWTDEIHITDDRKDKEDDDVIKKFKEFVCELDIKNKRDY